MSEKPIEKDLDKQADSYDGVVQKELFGEKKQAWESLLLKRQCSPFVHIKR